MVGLHNRGWLSGQAVKPSALGFYCLFVLSLFLDRGILPAQESSDPAYRPRYYARLQKDEFTNLLLPKEQMLLIFVRQIHDEMAQRRRAGVSLSRLGIDDLVSPDSKMMDLYTKELEKVQSLTKEIEALEIRAKRQSDFEVLNAIAMLRRRIREMVETHSVPDLPDGVSGGDGFPPDQETLVLKTAPASAERKTTDSEDLFEQWQYNRLLNYKLKLTQYELIHAKLLRGGSESENERMFKRDIRDAFVAYSAGEFTLSRLLFRRLLSTYPDRRLDDVLFYAGESSYALNYLDEALDSYRRMIQQYPASDYTARALVKLFNVFYIYRDNKKLNRTYETLRRFRAQLDDDTWNTLTYLLAYAEFRNMQYREAIGHFFAVDPSHAYYYPALYLAATCQVNLGQKHQAMRLYQKIAKELSGRRSNPVFGQIRNNALLKLGLSYYETGENDRAIAILDQVSESSDYYDLSVMAKAWSAFRAGRPGETLMNVDALFQTSAVSDYVYEAKLLAASAKELLGKKEEALSDLRELYHIARQDAVNPVSPSGITEDAVRALIEPLSPGEKRNRVLMRQAGRIHEFLHGRGETRQTKDRAEKQEMSRYQALNMQLANLDTLEREAKDREDSEMVSQIRGVRSQLLVLLKDETGSREFDDETERDDDLIRSLGMTRYLNYTFERLNHEVRREKEFTAAALSEIVEAIRSAREEDQYNRGLRLEIRQTELEDYLLKLNQFEVWIIENIPRSGQMDISQWASFSGYGISNITFSRIKDIEARMETLSRSVQGLNTVIQNRQIAFEQRIQGLMDDVTHIELQMRREERRRETLEKERFFETQYFDRQPKETSAGPVREPAARK